MKTVQKYWVLSLFMMAGLIFAGCGDTATDGGGSTDTTETSEGSGDAKEDANEGSAENASTETGNSDFQLVSLNVPHMT